MRSSAILSLLCLALGTQAALAQPAQCPPKQHVVYIRKGDNDTLAGRKLLTDTLINGVQTPNTSVLLAPDVVIDFRDVVGAPTSSPLIRFAHCVTLASYLPDQGPVATARSADSSSPPSNEMPAAIARTTRGALSPLTGLQTPPTPGSGRTPHTLGPLLIYGINPNRTDDPVFLEANCNDPTVETGYGEGARIAGIRIRGPNLNDHFTGESGINITGCHDVEISNMDIAGWGGQAIGVDDLAHFTAIPTSQPSEILILIHDNYIHHNQHSSSGHSSLGYGIDVGRGAFVVISQNVFDYNKHSITAGGDAGGYRALRNLILKGGGFQNSPVMRDIQVFDVHGTANCVELPSVGGVWGGIGIGAGIGAAVGWLVGGGPVGGGVGAIVGGLVGGLYGWLSDASHHRFNCGDAGFAFTFAENTFQYKKTIDINIRGKPKGPAIISGNIFVRSDRDAAIELDSPQAVEVTSTNRYNIETFGNYGVCDIDGDGLDDLFLATGVTWWFSSAGMYPWSYLKADSAELKNLKLGDVDGDGHCDVVKDAGGGAWMVSRGATGDWQPLGNYLAPLSDVQWGRFDPNAPDLNRGVRSPTHAFWRGDGGFWFATPFSQPNGWTVLGTSSFPLSDLRFGDFTGDGVTDVLANEGPGAHWAIAKSAREVWTPLGSPEHDPVKNLFIANMDADDNVDDLLRLDVQPVITAQPTPGVLTFTVTWQRSRNGTSAWTSWKSYPLSYNSYTPDHVLPGYGFVGQFRGAPGASALTIDTDRIGHFYSPAQGRDREEWQSLFAY